MSGFRIDDASLEAFDRDGYLVVDGLLGDEEVRLLREIARADRALEAESYTRTDGEGGAIRLALQNEAGDDVYGAICRSERIVRTMQRLLRDEVYHYHHKTILKEPKVGGAWAWHQDYGYWYHNGCLFPTMASCMIAIDRATRKNGCLQVVKGSHLAGRIDHGPVGEQTGADPEHVAALLDRLERVYVELAPGAAVFFHANLLHRSDQNTSDDPRWAFICCYNTKGNDPYKESRHPRYTPLEVWPDERVAEVARRDAARLQVES